MADSREASARITGSAHSSPPRLAERPAVALSCAHATAGPTTKKKSGKIARSAHRQCARTLAPALRPRRIALAGARPASQHKLRASGTTRAAAGWPPAELATPPALAPATARARIWSQFPMIFGGAEVADRHRAGARALARSSLARSLAWVRTRTHRDLDGLADHIGEQVGHPLLHGARRAATVCRRRLCCRVRRARALGDAAGAPRLAHAASAREARPNARTHARGARRARRGPRSLPAALERPHHLLRRSRCSPECVLWHPFPPAGPSSRPSRARARARARAPDAI